MPIPGGCYTFFRSSGFLLFGYVEDVMSGVVVSTVCCQLSTIFFGLMLAYWINYGFFYQQSSVQWRFPLVIQMVFAIYCISVTVFLPDTPRWLSKYSASPEKGTAVLVRLRDEPINHPEV